MTGDVTVISAPSPMELAPQALDLSLPRMRLGEAAPTFAAQAAARLGNAQRQARALRLGEATELLVLNEDVPSIMLPGEAPPHIKIPLSIAKIELNALGIGEEGSILRLTASVKRGPGFRLHIKF